MTRTTFVLGTAAAFGLSAIASADAILTYTYSDLSGSYDAGAAVFTAGADSRSSGDVTRIDGAGGTAEFHAGFNAIGLADYVISVNVSGNDGSTASGAGSFTATDLNGDTVTGSISGTWVNGSFGTVFFNGHLSDVLVADNSGDGTFDGTAAGSFSTDFSGYPTPLSGAIVMLFIAPQGEFMTQSFSDVPSLVNAAIVPAPGALALLLGAGMAGVRRRR